ncbi:MAG: hypothetical protein GWP10_03070 [Nitrospiraceae bacterium]|nr:hypothetical protein [Nitrospiraceae bacterium]
MFVVAFLAGCASYGHRVAPVPLPEAQANHKTVDGVNMVAVAYPDAKIAKKRFGFDIRGAGLLPIRLVIENNGTKKVMVDPNQTFLIDRIGQAWPLLSAEEAYKRIKSHVEIGETAKGTAKPAVLLGSAGALAGFAIGILSGRDVGESVGKGAVLGATAGALAGGASAYGKNSEKIKEDLAHRTLCNRPIRPGELAYGFLFFPGHNEVTSLQRLRLAINIGTKQHIVDIKLSSPVTP